MERLTTPDVKFRFVRHKLTSETNPEMRTEMYKHAKAIIPDGWTYVESYTSGKTLFDILDENGTVVLHTRREQCLRPFLDGIRYGRKYAE